MALDKDNREELSFNYQVNLLHKASESGEDFITFPNIFGEKEQDLKVCLLNYTQSLFDESVEMSATVVIADEIPFTISYDQAEQQMEIAFDGSNIAFKEGTSIDDVKCIVFYEQTQMYGKIAYIAKNVDKLETQDKLQSWYISPAYNLQN